MLDKFLENKKQLKQRKLTYYDIDTYTIDRLIDR